VYFHAIYTDSWKKHIHNVISLLRIPRLLAVGSFVSVTELKFAFQYLPGLFLVFVLRFAVQYCLQPGVFNYPVFVVCAAVSRAVFSTPRLIYIYITAIGLTPGGSSTSHIYTQTTHIIQGNKNLGSAGRAPSLRLIPWHLPYN
jgi:hypothetical protein